MADHGGEYKSIEEVRSMLYPRRPGLLSLSKEEVLEFPASLAGDAPDAATGPGVPRINRRVGRE
jgi:hypothetical protein